MSPAAPPQALRDDVCMDFVNTRYWRGSEIPTETLADPADLLRWTEGVGGGPPAAVEALRARWRSSPAETAGDFAEALRWREALYAVLKAVADGAAPTATELAALNAALARAPARDRIEREAGGFAWTIPPAPGIAGVLGPVLWSAGDLLAGSRLARVKCCANPLCGWVFLDDSKSGNRRWCSMSACGNRAKAHRHYVRRRQS